jgi:hypothetical protein
MAITTKKPFIYTKESKFHGEPVSSSSVSQLARNGIHKLVAASTYTLQGPEVGSLVTIYSVGVDASVISKTSTGGQVAFAATGGTQVLNLLYDSTVINTPCVTLLGEAATQWRIINVVAPPVNWASSNAAVTVTT